jgi:hypothetical protein
MKLQDAEKKHQPFDVPAGMAVVMLKQGYVEVQPAPKPTAAQTKWNAFQPLGTTPVIRHNCPNCGQSGYTESQRGTAHTSAKFSHCGKTETCPAEVANTYLRLWATYVAGTRRR